MQTFYVEPVTQKKLNLFTPKMAFYDNFSTLIGPLGRNLPDTN